MPIPYYRSTLLDFVEFTAIFEHHIIVTYYVDDNLNILPLAIGRDPENISYIRRALVVFHPTVAVYKLWVSNQRRT